MPKERWVLDRDKHENLEDEVLAAPPRNQRSYFHMIEYSAYKQAMERILLLSDQLFQARQKIFELETKRD